MQIKPFTFRQFAQRTTRLPLMLSAMGLFVALGAPRIAHAQSGVEVISAAKLKEIEAKLAAESKTAGFASVTLHKYGNHLTMLAHREAPGSSELHLKDADIFVILKGDATLVSGGKMVKGKTTAENEVRGTGIEGGESQKVAAGDVVHIPANVPHQMILTKGHIVTYFVVKVTQ